MAIPEMQRESRRLRCLALKSGFSVAVVPTHASFTFCSRTVHKFKSKAAHIEIGYGIEISRPICAIMMGALFFFFYKIVHNVDLYKIYLQSLSLCSPLSICFADSHQQQQEKNLTVPATPTAAWVVKLDD